MTIEQPEVVKILDALITFQHAGDIDAQANLIGGLDDTSLAVCLGEAIVQWTDAIDELQNVTAASSAPEAHQPTGLPSPPDPNVHQLVLRRVGRSAGLRVVPS